MSYFAGSTIPGMFTAAIATLALFTSASLIFVIEPLIGKLLLPLLGSSPSVWTACMMFYQVSLLLGYLLAALAIRSSNRSFVLGGVLLVALSLGILQLPIPADRALIGTASGDPTLWILSWLVLNVSLPFVALSLTSPIVQRIYSLRDGDKNRDPYFLYAASNLGSFIGLLSYPLLVEPQFDLKGQTALVVYGYYVLIGVVATNLLFNLRADEKPLEGSSIELAASEKRGFLGWCLGAFIPSSLMLSVTTHITTNVAPVPLFWVMPLSLYLLTFVIAFSSRQFSALTLIKRMFPLALLALGAISLFAMELNPWLLIGVELGLFFIVTLGIHLEIARTRPVAAELGWYYLALALGGACGGVVNSLVAPTIFSDLYEFPLCVALAAFFASSYGRVSNLLFGLVAIGLLSYYSLLGLEVLTALEVGEAFLHSAQAPVLILFGIPALLIFPFRGAPRRFALMFLGVTVAAISLRGIFSPAASLSFRNFYGIKRIEQDPKQGLTTLVVGGVAHGAQYTDPSKRKIPLTYYHPAGPVGDLFKIIHSERDAINVGIVGLGAGAMACYARPSDKFKFFELDPAVIEIATTLQHFSFIEDCAPDAELIQGDGRLKLLEVADRSFDMLVLDAFSGDVVPAHLLTHEALEIYKTKTKPGGVILMHLSNRFLNLVPNVANIATASNLSAFVREDPGSTEVGEEGPRYSSTYLAIPLGGEVARELAGNSAWNLTRSDGSHKLWRDDYHHILSAIRW